MAVVRLSGELKQTIIKRVSALFDGRINIKNAEIRSFSKALFDIWHRSVQHPVVAELYNTLTLADDKKGLDFFVMGDHVQVKVQYNIPPGIPGNAPPGTYSYIMDARSPDPVPIPKHVQRYDYRPTVLPPKELNDALVDLYRLESERKALVEKVEKILDDLSTLQQVHKVFPSILDFCPSETVAKFNKKVTRAASQANEVKVTDDLVLGLTKARMLSNVTSNESSTG